MKQILKDLFMLLILKLVIFLTAFILLFYDLCKD